MQGISAKLDSNLIEQFDKPIATTEDGKTEATEDVKIEAETTKADDLVEKLEDTLTTNNSE